MHYFYKTYIPFFLILLLSSGFVMGICDEKTQKIVIQSEPYLLYGKIDVAKNTAFGQGSLIKNGLETTNLRTWDTLLECCHLAVFNLIEKSKAPEQYTHYITQLSSITDFIKNTINTLHKEYAWLFDNINAPKKLARSFTDDDTLYLDGLRNEIIKKNKTVANIIGLSLKEINNTATMQKKTLMMPTTLEAILPCYKEFFNSYFQAKKGMPSHRLRSHELTYFLSMTNVFSEKCLKGTYRTDVEKAAALVDVLEILNLWLEENSTSKIVKENKKMLTASNEIIEGLFNIFPQMITNNTFKKLPLTHDKASIIIFAEAKALLSVLDEMLKEIKQLLIKERK